MPFIPSTVALALCAASFNVDRPRTVEAEGQGFATLDRVWIRG